MFWLPLLAVTADDQRAIFFYLGLIVALAVVVVATALVVRRWVLREEEAEESGSFTLADLRDLHAAGELSDEEFEAARRKMVAVHKAALRADEGEGKNTGQSDKERGGDAAAGA